MIFAGFHLSCVPVLDLGLGFAAYAQVTVPRTLINPGVSSLVHQLTIGRGDLRTVANGGFVTDAGGDDICFYLPGGEDRLKHDLISYNGTTGAIDVKVRLEDVDRMGEVEYLIRIGNPSITSPTEDAAAVASPTPDQSITTDLGFADQMSPFFITGEPVLVDAPHLSASIPAGGTFDFDVLAGQPGARISDRGTPPAGKVSVVGDKLRYTAPATTGTRDWAYELSRLGQTDTGILRAIVTGGSLTLPTPLDTIAVSTQGQFNTAIDTAAPGDLINLANGTYAWRALANHGTLANPVVLKAVNKGAVTITGAKACTKDHYIFWGIDLGDTGGTVSGDDVRFWYCSGSDNDTGSYLVVTGEDFTFEFCELFDFGRSGIVLDVLNGCRRPLIRYSDFRDFHPPATGDGFEVIRIGLAGDATNIECGALLEYNRFFECGLNSEERETVSVRSSGNQVRFCTFEKARTLTLRHGERNIAWGCTAKGPQGGISVRDRGNGVYGCDVAAGGLGIEVYAGTATPAEWDALTNEQRKGRTVAALDTLVIGSSASKIVVGQDDDGASVKAIGTRIEKTTGPVALKAQSDTLAKATTALDYPSPVYLKATDVGPAADEIDDPIDDGGEAAELSVPLTTATTVTTFDALVEALKAAIPGQRIPVANGTYDGPLQISRSGARGKEIQLYGVTKLGATITGRITVNGSDVVLSRLNIPKGVDLSGDRGRLNRCTCLNPDDDVRAVVMIRGRDCRVDGNEIDDFWKEGITSTGYNPVIERNYVHGKHASAAGTASACISSGTDKSDSGLSLAAVIRENLVQECDENNGIEIKSSDNDVVGNTVKGYGPRPGNINNRHGTRNRYRANYIEDGDLILSDEFCVALRNRTGSGSGSRCNINAGETTGDNLRKGNPGIVRAEDALVVEHDGPIEIGWKSHNGCTKAPLRTVLVDCSGTITETLGSYTTKPTSGLTMPDAAVELSTSDVGPYWLRPGGASAGSFLMESSGHIMLEDATSKLLLE